jgi:excisionase family DNA binding protein
VVTDAIDRAAEAKKGSPFLTTKQAAHYVGLSYETLEKMRRKGRGPHFRRHGRYVRYHIDDLEAWSETNGGSASNRQPSQPGEPGGDPNSR